MKRRAYFSRLLISFFIVSILPLIAAGAAFRASSMSIVMKTNTQRGRDAALVAASSAAGYLEECRHAVYSISRNPVVSGAFARGVVHDSERLKAMYRALYSGIDGMLYDASVHVVSADGRRNFSTHELPDRYNLADYANFEGIFSDIREVPERTYLYLDPFLSERGERVACSLLREIDGGFVIMDIFAATLASRTEQPIFSSMILADMRQFRAVDLIHPDRSGTFDRFPELGVLSGPGGPAQDAGDPF